ncbi:MAG: hypothetical protein LBT12_07025, partial [Oscillospiraceae bacterium]|nr:hypothetical protein [Oscillospiraceae bacterium]
ADKKELETRIAIEENREVFLTVEQVTFFLQSLQKGNIDDPNTRRGIVSIFLSAVYLYDDKFTLILNGGNAPMTISDELLDDIATSNAEVENATAQECNDAEILGLTPSSSYGNIGSPCS